MLFKSGINNSFLHPKNWPLTLKITLSLVTMVMAAVISITLLSIRREQQTFQTELKEQAVILLNTLEIASIDALYHLDTDYLSDLMEALGENQELLVSGRFYNNEGRVIADAYNEKIAFLLDIDPFGRRLIESSTAIFEWHEDRLRAGCAIHAGKSHLGAISIGLPIFPLKTKISEMRNRGFNTALILIIAGIFIAIIISRSISRPLREMVNTTKAITAGDLSQSISSGSSDEVGILADSFNNMIQRLSQSLTSLKENEKQLKASLAEKELLLKEIHHRVKNNLQVISSLLKLESAITKDSQVMAILKQTQERVRAIGIIHEILYKSDNFSLISTVDYIRRLTTYLFSSYGVESKTIALKTDIEDMLIDLNRGIPCGLIINELISNSLKYAFPQGKKGEITVSFHYIDDKYILVISDNGVGLPKKLNPQQSQTLGLTIVNTLVKQLEGTIEFNAQAGTTFKIIFL